MTAALALFLLAGAQKGDRWAVPTPRIFASPAGMYAFRVVPTADAKGATGTLFTLDATGAEKPIWTQKLVCLPVEARISELGHVATMDFWGTKGKSHALVLYDRSGKVVGDYALKELFPGAPPEQHPYFLVTPSSVHWTLSTEVGFDLINPIGKDLPATASGSRLYLRGVWRETVIFDPDSGKLLLREKLS